jgi:Tol biopolymer transport system component
MRKLLLFVMSLTAVSFAKNWDCEILPAEQKVEIDSISGAKIVFITTNAANDNNFYFHDRCWLPDEKMMLFRSDRSGRNEIYGYLPKTGELVRLNGTNKDNAGGGLASRFADKIFVVKNNILYQWDVQIIYSPETKVSVSEKKICELIKNTRFSGGLNENSDGSLLSFIYSSEGNQYIATADINSGKIETIAQFGADFRIQHLQFSWTRPDLLSFARSYGSDTAPLDPAEPRHARIWFVNIHTKTPVPAFYQQPGELVTHECWWVNDQITFINGFRKDEGNVSVLDIKTGERRIIGMGAWMNDVSAKKLAEYNWWHESGSPDGRWLVGDNWHGIIAVFNAKTTEKHILTTGHRIYGKGAHPHAGRDLDGSSVEFTSNKLGNPDVCIGYLPQQWLDDK